MIAAFAAGMLLAATVVTASEASSKVEKPSTSKPGAIELPPVPEGVTHLDFASFFKRPVGPKGMEIADEVLALNGKRVRLLGYMVKQSNPSPWKILLSPVPVVTREREYSYADDLPPNVVHVFLPRDAHPIRPHTPGLLLLTGRFEVGNREEADERVSLFRLHLDPPTRPAKPPAASANAASLEKPADVATTP
jgi:hypothetical protein